MTQIKETYTFESKPSKTMPQIMPHFMPHHCRFPLVRVCKGGVGLSG